METKVQIKNNMQQQKTSLFRFNNEKNCTFARRKLNLNQK